MSDFLNLGNCFPPCDSCQLISRSRTDGSEVKCAQAVLTMSSYRTFRACNFTLPKRMHYHLSYRVFNVVLEVVLLVDHVDVSFKIRPFHLMQVIFTQSVGHLHTICGSFPHDLSKRPCYRPSYHVPGFGVNMIFTCRISRTLIVLRGKLPALGLSRDVNARHL